VEGVVVRVLNFKNKVLSLIVHLMVDYQPILARLYSILQLGNEVLFLERYISFNNGISYLSFLTK
jgi:hypothetical protein